MIDPRCKCPMSISLTGDGCRYCQPQEHIDRLQDGLDEMDELWSRIVEVYDSGLSREGLIVAYDRVIEQYERCTK